MWKLQICKENENEYLNYIVKDPVKIYDIFGNNIGYCLKEYYFGSSTRIGDLGTFYYIKTRLMKKIKLRLIDDNNEIIYETQLTTKNIKKLKKTEFGSNQLIKNAKIHVRDLHRWENYPIEIAGITIYN
jgi:hypothetical protein